MMRPAVVGGCVLVECAKADVVGELGDAHFPAISVSCAHLIGFKTLFFIQHV